MKKIPSAKNGLRRSFVKDRVVQQIIRQIESGALKAGDALISEDRLCTEYKISLVSVRRALEELRAMGLIEKKWGKGNFVAKSSVPAYIGVLVPNMTNPVFHEYLDEISRQVVNSGCQVVLGNAENNRQKHAVLVEDFARRGIMHILKFPNILSEEGKIRARMAELNMNVVVLNDFWTDLPGRNVRVDEAAGAALAMRHLIQLGHRRIAYVDREDELRAVFYKTYVKELEAVGAFQKDYVFLRNVNMFKDSVQFLAAQKGKITACLTPYDCMAIYFQEILTGQHGYSIPEDLALVGFDDVREAAKPSVALTTLRQPKAEIVEQALGLLLNSANAQGTSVLIQVKPELVIRRSTAGRKAPVSDDKMTAAIEAAMPIG